MRPISGSNARFAKRNHGPDQLSARATGDQARCSSRTTTIPNVFVSYFLQLGSPTRIRSTASTLEGGHPSLTIYLGSPFFRLVRDSERGRALSFFTALFDIGVLVGGPTLGLLVERVDYSTMYVVTAALVIAGMVVFAFWDRRRS